MSGGVAYTTMDESNVRAVQNLNGAVLPLPYDERFYRQILQQHNQGRYCTYVEALLPSPPLCLAKRW
jgi:hypothetical protein